MKVIIAGSRTITSMTDLEKAIELTNLNTSIRITTLICGMARGVDTLAYNWAKKQGIPIEEYPANWNLYGKSAGYKRNVQMAENAEALIALWDGVSKGTKHMIDIAKERNLIVYIVDKSKKEYIRADSFFKNPEKTTIAEDVRNQTLKESAENIIDKSVLKYNEGLSGLGSNIIGAEGQDK